MRNTCVSTAMPSHLPKLTFMTMLAVLRPTPGSFCSSSMVWGTSPPKSAMIMRAQFMQLSALLW